MRLLAISCLAGGYAKTTTSVSLAAVFVARGLNVVVVDLDPQASATLTLGEHAAASPLTEAASVLSHLVPVVTQSCHPGTLRLLRGGRTLATASSHEVQRQLARAYEGADVVVVDTAPALTVGTLVATRQAALTLIPLRATPLAIATLADTLQLTSRAQNPGRARAVLTQANSRRAMVGLMVTSLQARHPGVLYDVRIPDDARCEQATLARRPVPVFAPRSRAAIAYERLASVVLDDLGFSCGTAASQGTTEGPDAAA